MGGPGLGTTAIALIGFGEVSRSEVPRACDEPPNFSSIDAQQ
jgi:hypothetical protein